MESGDNGGVNHVFRINLTIKSKTLVHVRIFHVLYMRYPPSGKFRTPVSPLILSVHAVDLA